ncbi:hypothetical protein P280DRAFT_152622 [Massarina eburnea CBS 473.64]|uniref:C3H1-type domain-containing protein n=1 Tax=Massarina eburnea CBS 473.64 TaxID=1395130 RepID=A0A6A6RML5_9PLEO|nr:hypothetical protein P280DRAFT_152622 [Massarina eburnea CBS 473.64]
MDRAGLRKRPEILSLSSSNFDSFPDHQLLVSYPSSEDSVIYIGQKFIGLPEQDTPSPHASSSYAPVSPSLPTPQDMSPIFLLSPTPDPSPVVMSPTFELSPTPSPTSPSLIATRSPTPTLIDPRNDEIKETCFFWYHNDTCRRGSDCPFEHEFRYNWPITVPPGYVHWSPCAMRMCPLRDDLVELQRLERESLAAQIDESAEEAGSVNDEDAEELEQDGFIEVIDLTQSDTESETDNSDDSDSESVVSISSPISHSSPSKGLDNNYQSDEEKPPLSISHANTMPRTNKRKERAYSHSDPSPCHKRHTFYSLKESSLASPVHKLPLKPTSSSPSNTHSPLKSASKSPQFSHIAADGVPYICFYWYHYGDCHPTRGRNGLVPVCKYLHTLDVMPKRVSLPPRLGEHANCMKPLCSASAARSNTVAAPTDAQLTPKTPTMPAAMHAMQAYTRAANRSDHGQQQPTSCDDKCKRFYEQQKQMSESRQVKDGSSTPSKRRNHRTKAQRRRAHEARLLAEQKQKLDTTNDENAKVAAHVSDFFNKLPEFDPVKIRHALLKTGEEHAKSMNGYACVYVSGFMLARPGYSQSGAEEIRDTVLQHKMDQERGLQMGVKQDVDEQIVKQDAAEHNTAEQSANEQSVVEQSANAQSINEQSVAEHPAEKESSIIPEPHVPVDASLPQDADRLDWVRN